MAKVELKRLVIFGLRIFARVFVFIYCANAEFNVAPRRRHRCRRRRCDRAKAAILGEQAAATTCNPDENTIAPSNFAFGCPTETCKCYEARFPR